MSGDGEILDVIEVVTKSVVRGTERGKIDPVIEGSP
jgi:hypothetical protein